MPDADRSWERAMKRLHPFHAVVFDLDGTLCWLHLDWTAVQEELAELALKERGLDFSALTVWEMLRRSEGSFRRALEAVLRARELEGARRATPLPLAGLVSRLAGKGRGVVSLNSGESCRHALTNIGIAESIDVVIGREDVSPFKPHPAPLLACLQRLNAEPDEAVFVGDRDRDRLTAERAGTAYIRADELSGETGASRRG